MMSTSSSSLSARKRAGIPLPNPSLPSYLADSPISHLFTLDPNPSPSSNCIHLPALWNSKDKNPLISVSNNGLQAEYTGPGHTDNDAAAVRSNVYIPSSVGIYYYETKIINQGRDGYIGIGLSSGQVPLNRLPGWEPGSWGYHGDDGHIFINSGTGIKYGPTFTTGDVIGCGLDMIHKSLFFTKNGIHLGYAIKPSSGGGGFSPAKLFPSIGMRTPNESVHVNFGIDPFVFNISAYVAEQRSTLFQTHILSDLECGNGMYVDLVMDYLVFHGYLNTVSHLFKSLAKTKSTGVFACRYIDKDPSQVMNEMKERRQVCSLIETGDIEKAYELITSFDNDVIPSIAFEIECQIFVERIRHQSMSALNYGRQTLARWLLYIDDTYIQTKLKQIMLLLAYPNPELVPTLEPILNLNQRTKLADLVNAYLLHHNTNHSDDTHQVHRPALELASSQVRVALHLSALHGTPACLLDWPNHIFDP